ncbi:hypothetical protein LTR12_012482 [Friedmanniomyces endolithicus]|nr:hypothetical protein LTR12_012482 [Friedmanniomyces endolithicus]
MYASTPRPVPSTAALKALRQLAYISSGTVIGVATLCAEERRRRTQVIQKIADNARRIRQSPRHYQNAALATQDAEDGIIGGSGGFDWVPAYTQARDRNGERSRTKGRVLEDGRSVSRGPELPSFVHRGYAQLEEQCKTDEELRKPRRQRTRVGIKQITKAAQPQPRGIVEPQAQLRAHNKAKQRISAKIPTAHGRPAEPIAPSQPAQTLHRIDPVSLLPRIATRKDESSRLRKSSNAAPMHSSDAGSSGEVRSRLGDASVRAPEKEVGDFDSLQIRCRALLASSQVGTTLELLHANKAVITISSQGKTLVVECFHAAIASNEVATMLNTLRLAETLLPKDDYRSIYELFLEYCDEKGIYDAPVRTLQKRSKSREDLFADLSSKAIEILAYACTKSTKPFFSVDYFTILFRRLPVDMRGRLMDSWRSSLQVLQADWRATRNMGTIGIRIKRLRALFRDGGLTEALHRLENIAVDIYVRADSHDLALNAVATLHADSPHDAFTISVVASLLAKKGDWSSLDQLLVVAKQSDTLKLDGDANRRFNATIHSYAKCHSSTEAWKFVTALVDDLGFRPNQTTNEIMLRAFISKNTTDLIPKWIRYTRIMGLRFRMDAKLAAKLLTWYYHDYRPSHVLLMWFCRRLAHFAPSLAGPEYLRLVEQALGFDLRSLEGEHNRNTTWRRSHAEARLAVLGDEESGVVPSPGWAWNKQLHFVHPDAIPKSGLGGPTASATSVQPDDELPSMIRIEDLRPLPEESDQTSGMAHDGAITEASAAAAKATPESFVQPERPMILALSSHDHEKVLRIYHQSLDATGLPASPHALEIAVEASLRQDQGDPARANAVLRQAKDAGMNITGAMGPMLIHRMKRLRRGDRGELDRLHETVTEYYQVNDQNGWPVRHHVGVTAASMLIKNDKAEQGLALLKAMFQSGETAKRPLDIVAMALFIEGYFAIGSVSGLRWAFKHVLRENMRIDQRFLHTIRSIFKPESDGLSRRSTFGEKSFKPVLVGFVQQCYERRESQMQEAKVLGRRLVACLAKCAREQEKPVVAVPARGDIEDELFGSRMRPLPLPTDGDTAEHVPDNESAHEEDTDANAKRRLRNLSRMQVRLADSIQSPESLGCRPAALRRHHNTRWLRQYRAFLRHDMTMPDGKTASFRYRLADNPRDSLAGKRRRKAERQGRDDVVDGVTATTVSGAVVPASAVRGPEKLHARVKRACSAMAEKTTGGRSDGGGVTIARRPSFRKTLREHGDSLPAEYLEALEQKRKQLDESIHKYIAAKEREYKQYEKELKQTTKNGGGLAATTVAVPAPPSASANGNGVAAPTKRRTSSESTQSATSPFLAPQQHGAVDTLLASGLRRQPVSPVMEEDSGGGGVDRPGSANLKDRRASAEREKDFVGLFTPQFLPLIDHKDERTPKRTESAPSNVQPSSRTTIPAGVPSLSKADSESAMYAKYKRPVHLQLAKRTSSSGSSADGKLASAMKSPQQSMQRPKRKRVSLAVGDSIVAPSDIVPVATKHSTTPSHSRTRSPETEREKVPIMNPGAIASVDFAKQPAQAPAIPSTSTAIVNPAPRNDEPQQLGRAPAPAASTAPTPRRSIDPDGDLFDLEDESDHPMGDFDSAIESEEDAAPGITGRVAHSHAPEDRHEIPVPSPRTQSGEPFTYDPEAGLIPEEPTSDTSPTFKPDPNQPLHLGSRPSASAAFFSPSSNSSHHSIPSPGFQRPTAASDPTFRGSNYYAEESKAAGDEEIYGSSYSRPATKGSFTGGSLGESFMAKHAEEMMRTRGGKKEMAVR